MALANSKVYGGGVRQRFAALSIAFWIQWRMAGAGNRSTPAGATSDITSREGIPH